MTMLFASKLNLRNILWSLFTKQSVYSNLKYVTCSLGYPDFIEMRMRLSVSWLTGQPSVNRRNDWNLQLLKHILSKPLA